MDAQLFICTWQQDLLWLKYCLLSVQRHWESDLKPFIIATPECKSLMPSIVDQLGCRVHYEPQNPDHHRGQIYVKMTADTLVDSPLILMTDSDCLFTRKCSADDFTKDGRPIVCMEDYATLIPRSILPDQGCFANYKMIIGTLLHILAEHEYMRRHPFLYYSDHIKEVREKIEKRIGKPLLKVMESYHSGYFSEFNIFGAYCYHNYRNMYHWQNIWTADPAIIHQFHSHSENPQFGAAEVLVSQILSR